jgi:hypothetical protein
MLVCILDGLYKALQPDSTQVPTLGCVAQHVHSGQCSNTGALCAPTSTIVTLVSGAATFGQLRM